MTRWTLLILPLGLATILVMTACWFGSGKDYPPAGEDRFADVRATLELTVDEDGGADVGGGTTDSIDLRGSAVVTRSDPELDVNGVQVVRMEVIDLELTGKSSFGPVIVRESATKRLPGQVRPNEQGDKFPAESFFDLFVEIDLPDLGVVLHNENFLSILATLSVVPPGEDEPYMGVENFRGPAYNEEFEQLGEFSFERFVFGPATTVRATPQPED